MSRPNATEIDWGVVSANLRCPICGEKASIEPGTDGFGGYHTHHFRISREYALELTRKHGKPTYEELEARIFELEAQLERIGS